ncbi:hypothetical protein MPSEU_000133300 [Mayamaea pseudoterrestris]|nr:hypothetical protein MPSEU_000133300 [Mayamaea pseudoterrestris]
MFRKTKKRPPTTAMRTSLTTPDDDDNEEAAPDNEPSLTFAGKSIHKLKRTIVRPTKKKSNSLASAVGFGGENDLFRNDDDDDIEDTANSTEASLYDLAALSQLQAEQLAYSAAAATTSDQAVDSVKDDVLMDDDDYVPLDASASATDNVLNGEDAMLLESRLQEVDMSVAMAMSSSDYANEPLPLNPMNDDDDDWANQVARRAGIVPASSSKTSFMAASSTTTASSVSNNNHSVILQQLCEKVDATLHQLAQQQFDLQRAQTHRQVELQNARNIHQTQQVDLHQSGQAVEYYQQLRARFASWVGGLRQLQLQVQPIQQALHELDAQVACIERRCEWENDMIAVLFHHGYLDKVIGRQPDPVVYYPWTSVTVDEFGRDVQSLYTMQREQRRKRRVLIAHQRGVEIIGDETDAFLTDDEKESLRERHKALQEALELALSSLDEDFTSLQNLVDMFGEWKNAYPEEYMQCHATLSLADLITPLIQAELCALNDPWNESGGYNESKWLAVIFGALESDVIDAAGVDRIIEKAVVPTLSDLLDKSGYELLSDRQCRSITVFWNHLGKIVPSGQSPVVTLLQKRMTDYIRSRLDDISMAIVKKEAIDAELEDEMLLSAFTDATVGQMHRVKKVLLNILFYWTSILGKDTDFIKSVLSFVSGKFLVLLASLHGFPQPRFAATPVDVFQEVYRALELTGWLDSDDLMLHTIPIRAAANMYQNLEVAAN